MPRCHRTLRTTPRVGRRLCREGHVCRSRSLLGRTRPILVRATEATLSQRGACGFHINVIRAAGRRDGRRENAATGPKGGITPANPPQRVGAMRGGQSAAIHAAPRGPATVTPLLVKRLLDRYAARSASTAARPHGRARDRASPHADHRVPRPR